MGTKKDVIILLDASGSMSGSIEGTIAAVNSLINKLKQSGEPILLSIFSFDNNVCILRDRIPIREVNFITDMEYYDGGGTGTYKAVNTAATKAIMYLKYHKEVQPSIFAVYTDGDPTDSGDLEGDHESEVASEEAGRKYIDTLRGLGYKIKYNTCDRRDSPEKAFHLFSIKNEEYNFYDINDKAALSAIYENLSNEIINKPSLGSVEIGGMK